MSGHILFLAHRMPFPPDRGDKIRSHHVLRHLVRLAPVHVGTLRDDPRDMEFEGELAALAASHCIAPRSKPLAVAGAEALLRREPVSLAAFRSSRLTAWVCEVLRAFPIDTIYVFSGQMGQYVPATFKGRIIADFVDVDSAKFEAYGSDGKGWRARVDRREGKLLRAMEADLAGRADASLLISAEEAALFRSRLPGGSPAAERVRVVPNGIDSALFAPDAVEPAIQLRDFPAPRIIFTGQMDYAPNIVAARRVADGILPALRTRFPTASFHVVGRNPPRDLLERHGRQGLHVWGEVPDMRAWLAGSELALVPLEIARGVQNKVLEAMAMGLPAVLSPGAATGIAAEDGVHFSIARTDIECVDKVAALLDDPAAARTMGHAARRFVAERMSWPAALAPLDSLLGHAPAQSSAA